MDKGLKAGIEALKTNYTRFLFYKVSGYG